MNFEDFCLYFDIEDVEPTKIGKKYFLLTDKQKDLNTKTDKDLSYGGAFLGEDNRKGFKPSFIFLDMANEVTDKKVVIKHSFEFLFLCGRDIMGKSLVGDTEFDKTMLVLVNNEHGECLGMGEVVRRFELIEKVVIKNLLDRGDFLRREKGK